MVGLGLITLACTPSQESEVQSLTPTSVEVSSTSISLATTTQAPTTSAPTTEASDAPTTATSEQPLEPGRLEPAAPAPISVRYFDDTGSYLSGHGLEYIQELEGPLFEVVDLLDYGLVFQRDREDNTIWVAGPEDPEPRELLVANDAQWLQLEGAEQLGLDADRAPLLYYQRHRFGSPAENESTLRSYNPASGEIRVIARTGGAEWGTTFSYLTGSKALAITGVEAPAMFIVDLDKDRDTSVFDLPEVCPGEVIAYEHGTFVGDQILGSRPIFNTHDGVVDQWGFYLLDPETCEEVLIESYPWNSGDFYVESFVGSVVNLKTEEFFDGSPLPAIKLDLTGEGESLSAPFPGFQRPGFLS